MYLFLCWTFNTRSCVINWFIAVSTDSKLAIRVFEHLPCWSKLTGLQLCQIFAFFGGSIYCLSCKIHYKAKDASLGKIPFIKALLVVTSISIGVNIKVTCFWQTLYLQQYTRYRPADLRDCVFIIHDLYLSRRGGGLQAVREKYKQSKVFCLTLCLWIMKKPLACFVFCSPLLFF